MSTMKHAFRVTLLAAALAALSFSCENNLLKRQTGIGNAQRARLCADAGASFDADRNECTCGKDSKWSGSACELVNQSPDINLPGVAEAPKAAEPEAAAPAASEAQADDPVHHRGPETEGDVPLTPPPAAAHAAEKHASDAHTKEAPHDAAKLTASEAEKPVADAGETVTLPVTSATDKLASDDQRARDFCRRGKGHWVRDDGYCFCPNGEVLVANKCRKLPGYLTDDTCRRAAHPGVWKNGTCHCKDAGMIFSPSRGGCVARRASSETTMRRICESSLNRGRWDAFEQRCRCPSGRVWHQELCQVQSGMTSKEVCATDFNKGAWDQKAKTCSCPDGFFWIDQACRQQRFVAEAEACKSERNRGKWDEAKQSCACPGKKKWRAASLSCELAR